MTQLRLNADADERPVICGNCDWEGTTATCNPDITDFEQRVAPGEIMPAGQCPECGALVHLKHEREQEVRNYRGVSIRLSKGSNPRFFARHAGQHFSGGSYETVRKKLDEVLQFQPFDALIISRDEIEQVRIISADMDDGNWCVERGGHTHGGTRIKFYTPIYTPQMRETLENWLAKLEAWNAQESNLKEARDTMRREVEALAISRPNKDE